MRSSELIDSSEPDREHGAAASAVPLQAALAVRAEDIASAIRDSSDSIARRQAARLWQALTAIDAAPPGELARAPMHDRPAPPITWIGPVTTDAQDAPDRSPAMPQHANSLAGRQTDTARELAMPWPKLVALFESFGLALALKPTVSDAGPGIRHIRAKLSAAQSRPRARPAAQRPEPQNALRKIAVNRNATLQTNACTLGVPLSCCAVSVAVAGHDGRPVLLMFPADSILDSARAAGIHGVAQPLQILAEDSVRFWFGAGSKAIGPVNAVVPVVADERLASSGDLLVGSNYDGAVFMHFHWGRDAIEPRFESLCKAPDSTADSAQHATTEPSVDFDIGQIDATSVGTCQIDIPRALAAIGQTGTDAVRLAPFDIVIGMAPAAASDWALRVRAEQLYRDCIHAGLDVVIDDCPGSSGAGHEDARWQRLARHAITVSGDHLSSDRVEHRNRLSDTSTLIAASAAAIAATVRSASLES